MLVLSQALVLAAQAAAIPADNPVIGWETVVEVGAITATSAATGYPVSNLLNPATHLLWKESPDSPAVDQYLTIAIGTVDDLDYVGIARHNFGTAGIVVSVEGYIDSVWTEIVEETMLPNDDAVLLRFEPQSLEAIRVRLQPGSAPAQAAVLYCGKLLEMERGLYVNHTPLSHGRKAKVVTGKSEAGNFLGRIVLNELRESVARFVLLDPAWYRTYMDDFLAQTSERPFFFAWRPATYPFETGFAWLTNDPMPAPDDQSHLIQVELVMQGVP